MNEGARAATSWLRGHGVTAPTTTRWHIEIALDVVGQRAPTDFDERTATRFHISVYSEEWGIYFCHGGRASWIRVTDIAFVHGRDELRLLGRLPALGDLGVLVRALEQEHVIRFRREHASISTNLPYAEPAIRSWLARL